MTLNRNSRLNTFLELKIENARLQARVQALKAQGLVVGEGSSAASERMQSAVDTHNPTAFYAALGAVGAPHAPSYSHPGLNDDTDGAPHKRRKTTSEPHVCTTCGRTDSPDWRKGPKGPKTLCNACGLRWAKKFRKFEESGGEGVAEPLDDIVPP